MATRRRSGTAKPSPRRARLVLSSPLPPCSWTPTHNSTSERSTQIHLSTVLNRMRCVQLASRRLLLLLHTRTPHLRISTSTWLHHGSWPPPRKGP
ncbi:hypothetical protein CORC01_03620 [Colletotrichum orchidophilum]|uniref:Uncharacterized protein n=1 Tax=Colletotrichum orchidophilum TaxID=1209926 RepID=A0A1G4BID3_9PEZI|nr:uncharacterized protein CORC01_03620 [Colletotrichum orchidophilum]OHF01053.1 hypothetical protein CORC01_03620 [Colletotrichum orchidophilum]